MTRRKLLAFAAWLFITSAAFANDYGAVRGVVHDPQHRPIQDAMVMLKAKSSEWAKSVTTDASGEFQTQRCPARRLLRQCRQSRASRKLRRMSSSSRDLCRSFIFSCRSPAANEKVTVSDTPAVVATDSFTPTTLISRLDIERTPGADRTNSMAMITDYVPGAYVTHDMLHMRGGHQTTWLLDGIPMINTAIAQNLGPQFDPKDMDYVEVNRGSYSAEFGDRTYGVFNVVPRTGFERNNEAELVVTAGNFYQTDDYFSFGSHTDRFAYYASVNANRSNLGLQPPVPQVMHDAVNGVGGFGSFIFNVDPSNQLRLVTSLRRDYLSDSLRSQSQRHRKDPARFTHPAIGLRDSQHESDAGVLFSWVHTFNSTSADHGFALLPLQQRRLCQLAERHSRSHHREPRLHLCGRPGQLRRQLQARTTCRRGSSASTSSDSQFFGAIFNDGSGNSPRSPITEQPTANLETFYHRRPSSSPFPG